MTTKFLLVPLVGLKLFFTKIVVNFVVFCHFRGSAADEKRKQDAHIAQLEEELEEERTQNELLVEKYKRANMQV